MDAGEPRVRRRGFFLHSDTGEPDTGEHENPEGFVVRVRVARSPASVTSNRATSRSSSGARLSGGRRGIERRTATSMDDSVSLRSATATGSRQRVHSPR
jgi:hypothetical protein